MEKFIQEQKGIIEHYINTSNIFKATGSIIGGMSVPYAAFHLMNLAAFLAGLQYAALGGIFALLGYSMPYIDGYVNRMLEIWQSITIRMQQEINQARQEEQALNDKIDERIKFYTQKAMDDIEAANQ